MVAVKKILNLMALRLYQGEPQICTDTLTNDGTLPLRPQAILQLVIALDSRNEEQLIELTLELEAGACQTLKRTLVTGELEIGDHASVLQALIEEQWETLGYAVFQVDEPPIQINKHPPDTRTTRTTSHPTR